MVFDAVVIGSGFGGAVSACRLAQAGLSVCILERGRDYRSHPVPHDYTNPLAGWLYGHDTGLYDVRATGEMIAVQGAGYGGGSLVYANVQMRPPADAFASWPSEYSRQVLDPYYDLVGYMLDIRPLPDAFRHKSPKTSMMLIAAERLGRKNEVYLPNLAVNFDGGAEPSANRHGALQTACTHCGKCDAGCGVRAKNTLDLNYLHLAEKAGADARTQCEARRVEPTPNGYRVTYLAADGSESSIEGRALFLCAGAINSTELLLRCRDQFGTLPALSPRLGEGYSGNGDFLAFIFEPDEKIVGEGADPSKGPTITTSLLFDQGSDEHRRWFVLQEGGMPAALMPALQLLHPQFPDLVPGPIAAAPCIEVDGRSEPVRALSQLFGEEVQKSFARFSQKRGDVGPVVLLAMGRDRADGKLALTPITNHLRVLWGVRNNLPLYNTQARLCHDVADALGGELVLNPAWQYLRRPVSVHNLGGCRMATSSAQGVTAPSGEVFGYPNLFVMDGAILPASTGVNPAHTIAAVAERNVEAFIHRQPGLAAWRAPEWRSVQPIIEPLDAIRVPQGGVKEPAYRTAGVSFRETMEGFLRHDGASQRAASGVAAIGVARFDLTVSIISVDDFVADASHAGELTGRLWAGTFTAPQGVEVSGGRFNLFAPGEAGSRELNYVIPFYGSDGKPYTFEGYKRVPDGLDLRPWRATTTLVTLVRARHEPSGPIVATGLLRLSMRAFLRQLTTFRTPGARTPVQAGTALAKFGTLFLGSLVSSYHE
jgi:cholesterol oxidase